MYPVSKVEMQYIMFVMAHGHAVVENKNLKMFKGIQPEACWVHVLYCSYFAAKTIF